jgi:dTDP-4-dehydrorhamnose 3,5-epimerase
MIDGVIVTPLRRIVDERGSVMHMLRSDAPYFSGFGEIYFSTVHPGSIKGWHIHHKMVLSYAVPEGQIKFVLFDDRPASPSHGELQEIFIGENNYCLVTVPPLVWNGFKGIGTKTAIVANCASIPHDPNEIDRKDPFDPSIPYDWTIKHR